MRIAAVTIRNYRSLKDVTFEIDSYAAFIGANGAGKSSVLYALDWFFNGTPFTDSDIHGYAEGSSPEPGASIQVSVSFADLTDSDRERLQQYGRGDRALIRRTWYADTRETKTVGNAWQGPGFAEVRADQGIAQRRNAYNDLRSSFTDLAEIERLADKDSILAALRDWESRPENSAKLVELADADASQMMGWNGANVLKKCVRYVLIPAGTSIAGEVGTASRGTALTELVGAFMTSASARAQAAWLEKHSDAVAELAGEIKKSIEGATGVQASRITERLSSFIPNASVSLTPTVPDFTPKLDPSISTAVTISGITNEVSRQGHGVQRAVMISMFQVMVPDEDLTRHAHEPREGEDDASTQARLEKLLSELPSIIVAIEEPEIYQHPIRARAFARTLYDLSTQRNVQVILASHSPYFIQPEQFDALHRFTYTGGETCVKTASAASVAAASGIEVSKIEKTITAYVPTEFAEGFFADAVVLVEGRTDRIVLEALAAKTGKDFDRMGVTVLSVEGKAGLRVAREILVALGIPTYVVADGDFGTSGRKSYKGKTPAEVVAAKAQAHSSHRHATEGLVAALPSTSFAARGSLPYAFGGPSLVCRDFAIWKDDLEDELGSWASFDDALDKSGIALASRTSKNLLAYRNAVMAADEDDLPDILNAVVQEIVQLSSQSA